jgi:hypothetical protein
LGYQMTSMEFKGVSITIEMMDRKTGVPSFQRVAIGTYIYRPVSLLEILDTFTDYEKMYLRHLMKYILFVQEYRRICFNRLFDHHYKVKLQIHPRV